MGVKKENRPLKRIVALSVLGLAAAVLLFGLGVPKAEPVEVPPGPPPSIRKPDLIELFSERGQRERSEPVDMADDPAEDSDWASSPGRLAQTTAELTSGQLVSCRVGDAQVADGKGMIASSDPNNDPQEGRHAVVPYILHTQVLGGMLLFAALPGTTSAEWVAEDSTRLRLTWTPSEDGSPVSCETVQSLSQRSGVFGAVVPDQPLDGGHIMVSGCGGFAQLDTPAGGEFFMEIDSATSCQLQASIVGLGPVPTVGPPLLLEPMAGQDITGVKLTVPVPVTDWPGLARLVLEWSEGATVWWDDQPDPGLSASAQRVQESLNQQADQVFDAVAQSAAMLLEREEVLDALSDDELEHLAQIAGE